MPRPTKFNSAVKAKLLGLAARGKTDVEMARAVGIARTTLDNWKREHPEFFAQLKEAKAVADLAVEASLFQRALGYQHPETKVFCNTTSGEIFTKTVMKHYPPDVTAQIFWLKNRIPKEWRERTGREGDLPDEGDEAQVKSAEAWLMGVLKKKAEIV
jgi:transcriptional regulator with XRE-family HTH domain